MISNEVTIGKNGKYIAKIWLTDDIIIFINDIVNFKIEEE